jgi:hypothetical protein
MLIAKALKGETRSIDVLMGWIVKLLPMVEAGVETSDLSAQDKEILQRALKRLARSDN